MRLQTIIMSTPTAPLMDDGIRLVALKSFMWCVVDRLDSCTNICTTACGREKDVLRSPKQRHYSSELKPLQVSTASEDVEQFAFRGTFPNDGTFPVTDDEMLDPRYHSFGDDSQVSVARPFDSDDRQSSRGVIREYFQQCAGEREEKKPGHYDPRQVSCRISNKKRVGNTQAAGLASGRG